MDPKEIFQKAVRLEQTERVPVMFLAGGIWELNENNLSFQDFLNMNPEESADYIYQQNERLNSDIVWTGAGCNNLALKALGAKLKMNRPGKGIDVKPLLKKPGDVDKLNPDALKNDPDINRLLESTRKLKDKLGNKRMLGASQWGPMTLANLLLGASEFMMDLIADKEAVIYLMEFTRELVLTYWNLFLEAGVDLVCQSEPVASGDMISREMFEEFAVGNLRYTNDKIQEKGCFRMLHICGNTEKILPLIPETHTDLFSMDWKNSLVQARKILGGKIAFAGQADPISTMLMAEKEEVKRICEACITDARWEEGGYLLMPGCDLAPGTSLENIRAMVETAYTHTQNIG